jgi:hypothetical protein
MNALTRKPRRFRGYAAIGAALLTAGLLSAWTGQATASPYRTAVSTIYCSQPSTLWNEASHKVLEVPIANINTNGAAVDQYSYVSGATNEQWCATEVTVDALGTVYTLKNQQSGKCLDDKNATVANHWPVLQDPCDGSAAQNWLLIPGATLGSTTGGAYLEPYLGTTTGFWVLEVSHSSLANHGAVDLYQLVTGAINELWCTVRC